MLHIRKLKTNRLKGEDTAKIPTSNSNKGFLEKWKMKIKILKPRRLIYIHIRKPFILLLNRRSMFPPSLQSSNLKF